MTRREWLMAIAAGVPFLPAIARIVTKCSTVSGRLASPLLEHMDSSTSRSWPSEDSPVRSLEEARRAMCMAWYDSEGASVHVIYPSRPADNVVIALDPLTGQELGRRYPARA